MRFEYRIAQPINLIALSVAAIVIFFGVKYKSDFDNNGYVSKEAITSISFQKYLMACLGGSLAMCYSSAVELLGKYLLNEQVDKKFILEFMLIMTVLLPSICLLGNLELNNAVAFFWPLFHVQIIIIVNVTLLFWANKMGLSKSSPDVLLNSALSCLTFTTHLFVPRASWTSSSTNSVPGLLYMLFFSGAIVSSARTVRLTYCKNTNKNAVVLINTAAAEQQWALLFSLSILLYYIAFLVLEAGVYPHNDHNHLQAGYLSANYVLLSVFALSVLTLHQRKEFYHGIISQASLEIKRVFVRYVSHEIRTPLNTTLLGLNLLANDVRDGTADTAVLTELIEDATGSCTIAIGILNDLLMYEKIDGGLLTLERSETPVWGFVEDVLKVFLIQAKSSEVELVWPQRCIKGVYAEIDKYKLSQVMRNLVSNALKFTPAGGKVRVVAEVLVPGAKPLGGRAISVLNEADEDDQEEGTATNGTAGVCAEDKGTLDKKPRRSSKRKNKTKPTAKSVDLKDDFTTIQRSVSQASEETPPHIYTLPPGFPHSPAQQQLHQRGAGGSHSNNNFTLSCDSNSLSARDGGGGKGSGRGSGEGGGGLFPGLVPELKGSNDAADQASTNSNAAAGIDLMTTGAVDSGADGDADIQGEEGTTRTFCVSTPAAQQQQQYTPQQQAKSKYLAGAGQQQQRQEPNGQDGDIEQGLGGLGMKNQETSSPESSQDSTPQKDPLTTFSEKTYALARKLFSGDSDNRSNLQVFPTVSVVRISVIDSGAGISKENQDRLFKEIVQFNAGKLQNGQGSGIGLWISNTIVKLHGGTIGVISAGEGHGSTFYIDIPISKIERGSNYSHVSPAHTDVSSKHKYNSPSCSPACSPQLRSRKHMGASSAEGGQPGTPAGSKPSPLLTQSFGSPNRNFISPESVNSAAHHSHHHHGAGGRHSQHPHPAAHVPHISSHSHNSDHHPKRGSGASALGGAGAGANTGAGAVSRDIPLSEIGSSLAGAGLGVQRTYSDDQSIFTGGGESNRSRGTMKSSFSTDEGGVSSRTDIDPSESWKAAISAVAGVGYGVSSASRDSALPAAQDHSSLPNPFPSIATNLFPEHGHARKLSVNTAHAVSAAAALVAAGSTVSSSSAISSSASTSSGSYSATFSSFGISSGKALPPSIAEEREECSDAFSPGSITAAAATAGADGQPGEASIKVGGGVATAGAGARTTSAAVGPSGLPRGCSNAALFGKYALIVDDSATNRKFVNRLLRTKIGIRDEAEDGQKAVDKVALSMKAGGRPYDVILMDYVMPVMDGPTATARIRALGYEGVILGVTGNGHQAEIDLFRTSGADRVLIKPLSADQFYDVLLEVLQPGGA